MYDQIGGGFHRYSVDARWLVPHFEKMLYDNAELPRLYLELHQATGDPAHRRVVAETLDYLLREMRHGDGGFFSATDADSEGEEGEVLRLDARRRWLRWSNRPTSIWCAGIGTSPRRATSRARTSRT